jgi:hypothetical protein
VSEKVKKPRGVPLGTRVRVRFPGAVLDAEVVEDRGFIGLGGRQIVVVRVLGPTYFPREMELPVAELEIVSEPGQDPGRTTRRKREQITVPVGTHVLIPFPQHKMDAEVIEHRGFIGVGGREMVRIRPMGSDDDQGAFDVPVDEIEIVAEQRVA